MLPLYTKNVISANFSFFDFLCHSFCFAGDGHQSPFFFFFFIFFTLSNEVSKSKSCRFKCVAHSLSPSFFKLLVIAIFLTFHSFLFYCILCLQPFFPLLFFKLSVRHQHPSRQLCFITLFALNDFFISLSSRIYTFDLSAFHLT